MTLDITTHKAILIKLLKEIFTNPQLAPYLGFKGGTAALLFYGLSRFSVDLDFDLLAADQAPQVFAMMTTLLQRFGTVKAQDKRYSLFFLLTYQDKQVGAQNIKIEINKRVFGSQFQVKQYLGISMPVMVPADMAAHKLVALSERLGKTNRDIFDVWFFLSQHWPVNQQIVTARTGLSYRQFLDRCISDLEQLPNRGILAGIGELLTAKQKAWAKAHLRDETIFLLKLERDKLT